jgi:heme/copper-type cytochrome/quinol oxidase subunit 2
MMLLFQVFSLSCYYYYYYCHLIQIRKNPFRNNSRRAVSVLIFQFLLAPSFVIISNAVITLEVILKVKKFFSKFSPYFCLWNWNWNWNWKWKFSKPKGGSKSENFQEPKSDENISLNFRIQKWKWKFSKPKPKSVEIFASSKK